MPADNASRREALADFLRARRARLKPADVGFRDDGASGRRRTPGLRREEVAELSGVGVTWYTWLEQGRDIVPSAQVIDALARALLLDEDQHRYLRELSGLTPTARGDPAEAVLPRLRRLVDAAAPNVASVYDAHFDYMVWNRPYVLVRHDPGEYTADRRNLLWMMFTDTTNRTRMVRWEPAARAVLSQFRTAFGRRPGDPRFQQIVSELSEVSGIPAVVGGVPGAVLPAHDDRYRSSRGRPDRAGAVSAAAGRAPGPAPGPPGTGERPGRPADSRAARTPVGRFVGR